MRVKWPLSVLALVTVVASMPQMAVAQEEGGAEALTAERYIELVRSDVKKERVQLITQAMDFSADEAAAFWPIYKDYEAEFTKVGDERLALIQDYAQHYWDMTDEKASGLARQALALEEKRTGLKRKCFERIEKEMSPVVAARFLQVENQINMLLDLQLAEELPLIQKAD